jgi:hypothetical protein
MTIKVSEIKQNIIIKIYSSTAEQCWHRNKVVEEEVKNYEFQFRKYQ